MHDSGFGKILLLLVLLTCPFSASHGAEVNQQQIEMLQQQLEQLQTRLDELTGENDKPTAAHGDNELSISGFFDIILHTTDNSETPFDPGTLELDIVYDKVENFAISAAMVWTEDGAEVGVAFLDYHVHDHSIPVRGSLYEEPGFHVQLGRFDIPFASDYNYYAAPDRPNITAPLTTDRILDGGLNGDGLRVYGAARSGLEYTVFWTNSLLENNGSSLGSRLGYSHNGYTLGVSTISDLDTHSHSRHQHLGMDIAIRMGIAEIIMEAIHLDTDDNMTLGDGTPTGLAEESGYHVSLKMNTQPVAIFLRYEKWKPEYTAVADPDNSTNSFAVETLERITLAGNYPIDEYLQFKFEYYNYLGSQTAEPDFDERKLSLQMVASF